VQLAGQKWLGS